MSRANTMPIDSEKLRKLVLDKGFITEISEFLGYSPYALSATLSKGKISRQMATLLDKMYGIKYEDYKPEEKKEEPIEEKPKPETEVISRDEAQLKTIISQLSALNNGLTAIYQKLEEINGNQKKEIHS